MNNSSTTLPNDTTDMNPPQAVLLNLDPNSSKDINTLTSVDLCREGIEDDDAPCRLDDTRRILDMHKNSRYTAGLYVAIILGCYLFGLLVLLVHHVKQKHGQVSLYDIYLELAPGSWCDADANVSGTATAATSQTVSSPSSREITSLGEEEDSFSETVPGERSRRFQGLSQSLRKKKRPPKLLFCQQRSTPLPPLRQTSDDCHPELEQLNPKREIVPLRPHPILKKGAALSSGKKNVPVSSARIQQRRADGIVQEESQVRGKTDPLLLKSETLILHCSREKEKKLESSLLTGGRTSVQCCHQSLFQSEEEKKNQVDMFITHSEEKIKDKVEEEDSSSSSSSSSRENNCAIVSSSSSSSSSDLVQEQHEETAL